MCPQIRDTNFCADFVVEISQICVPFLTWKHKFKKIHEKISFYSFFALYRDMFQKQFDNLKKYKINNCETCFCFFVKKI